MKKTSVTLVALSSVAVSLSGVATLTHADTTVISNNAPSNGYVTMDDNGKVIEASSPVLLEQKATTPANKNALLYGMSLSAVYPVSSHGTWTHWVDHRGSNNYKWSHSNYHDTKYYHYGEARVGHGSYVTHYASAGHWAYATAKGHGTAQAFYGYR